MEKRFKEFSFTKKWNLSNLSGVSKTICQKGAWLAGGAVRSIFDNTNIHDYDFYFNSVDIYVKTYMFLNNIGAKLIYRCPLDFLRTYEYNNEKYQLIFHKSFENMQSVIDEFDFTICQLITDSKILIVQNTTLKDIRKKQLKLWSLPYPAATIKRIYKYLNYGFTATPLLYQTIVEKISQKSQEIVDETLVYID